MSTEQILTDLLLGRLDEDLPRILIAVRDRQKTVADNLIKSLKNGDRVRFTASVRPSYLRGRVAIVRRVNQTTVTVDLVEPTGRFGNGVRTQSTLIEVIPVIPVDNTAPTPKRTIRRVGHL